MPRQFRLELTLRSEPRTGVSESRGAIRYRLAIWFSAYGNLVSVWSNDPQAPMPEQLESNVLRILEAAGYVPVPEAVLDLPYSGTNECAAAIRTWFTRFFDYC